MLREMMIMSKVLALLSGKGGSGKTTLALSIASMLSECSVKVLLIDSDLSTNGATYFYEGKLENRLKESGSFYNIFVNNENIIDDFININSNLDFLPSIAKITKNNTKSYQYGELDFRRMGNFDEQLRSYYDVIIYDCQSGYTDILRLILPYIDVNLVVMEADAISSAAIRSLYLKIGDILDSKKIYQVFNKATDEEYDIYSKVSGGTVFTNIETIRFDWKIRRAFAIGQIPDMRNTSAKYGEQIYNVCKVVFNDNEISKKLIKYETIIKYNRIIENEKEIRMRINSCYDINAMKRKRAFKVLYMIELLLNILVLLYCFEYSGDTASIYSYIKILFVVCSIFIVAITSILAMGDGSDSIKEIIRKTQELKIEQQKLLEIKKEKSILKEKVQGCYKESELY